MVYPLCPDNHSATKAGYVDPYLLKFQNMFQALFKNIFTQTKTNLINKKTVFTF